MVEKLKLKRFPCATPYKVLRLNKGQQVLVNECSIEFQIGGYNDNILCDIIPIDVCHMFLSRSWQYDRNAKYDSRKNTYAIEKDGVPHTLIPLKDEDKEHEGSSGIKCDG